MGNESNDKVLFIENDPETLNAILMEMSSAQCDLFMAQSKEQGREILKNKGIDLVVCSMELSGEGEDAFLALIKNRFPNTHRVLLNEAKEEGNVTKTIARGQATAHILKPWKEDSLRRNIEQILKVRNSLKKKSLLESINEIDALPSLPTLFQEFTEAVLNEKPFKEIAEIIEADVSLSARILQIANSAFYGAQETYSVSQAIARLGLNTVKDLVMTFAFVNDLTWTEEQMEHLKTIFTHSARVNKFLKHAHRIKHNAPLREELTCMGVTHDIGKVIILQYFPDRFQAILEHQKNNSNMSFHMSEKALGFNWFKHDEVGAYFLNMWNLPDPVIEATLYHHNPGDCSDGLKDAVKTLCFVNNLVTRVEMLSLEDDLESSIQDLKGFVSDEDLYVMAAQIQDERAFQV